MGTLLQTSTTSKPHPFLSLLTTVNPALTPHLSLRDEWHISPTCKLLSAVFVDRWHKDSHHHLAETKWCFPKQKVGKGLFGKRKLFFLFTWRFRDCCSVHADSVPPYLILPPNTKVLLDNKSCQVSFTFLSAICFLCLCWIIFWRGGQQLRV